jgi:protein transport protein SEC61 subunit beta
MAVGGAKQRRVPAGGAGGASSVLKFYTEEAPGLKIGPTTVLVLSLLFIGFVVLLHIWGKLTR